MILIVEGMDRCGKTTLVEALRKNCFVSPKILIHHSSSPPNILNKNDWEREHYTSLINTAIYLNDNGYNIIFDRFHLGAIVYGAKYRNADPSVIYNIDDTYMKNEPDIALLLLTDYPESIIARNDGESLETSLEEFKETHDSFIDAYTKSTIMNKMYVNVTDNGGFKNTYSAVVNFLNNIRYNE